MRFTFLILAILLIKTQAFSQFRFLYGDYGDFKCNIHYIGVEGHDNTKIGFGLGINERKCLLIYG